LNKNSKLWTVLHHKQRKYLILQHNSQCLPSASFHYTANHSRYPSGNLVYIQWTGFKQIKNICKVFTQQVHN